jgi:hypothetical protein
MYKNSTAGITEKAIKKQKSIYTKKSKNKLVYLGTERRETNLYLKIKVLSHI